MPIERNTNTFSVQNTINIPEGVDGEDYESDVSSISSNSAKLWASFQLYIKSNQEYNGGTSQYISLPEINNRKKKHRKRKSYDDRKITVPEGNTEGLVVHQRTSLFPQLINENRNSNNNAVQDIQPSTEDIRMLNRHKRSNPRHTTILIRRRAQQEQEDLLLQQQMSQQQGNNNNSSDYRPITLPPTRQKRGHEEWNLPPLPLLGQKHNLNLHQQQQQQQLEKLLHPELSNNHFNNNNNNLVVPITS